MHTRPILALPILAAVLAACGPGAAPRESPSALAAVDVRVRDSRTGEPLVGAEVRLYPLVEGEGGARHLGELGRWAERSGCLPLQLFARTLEVRTDGAGACGFHLPPRWSFLTVVEEASAPGSLTELAGMRVLRPVDGTLPGELLIEVPPPWDNPLPAEGFVRSAVDGVPIDGAQVSHLVFGYPMKRARDRRGRWLGVDLGQVVHSSLGFFPIVDEVAEGSYALIEAAGYSPRFVEVRTSTPEEPGIEDIALEPAAFLEVHLHDWQPEVPREIELSVSARRVDLGHALMPTSWIESWAPVVAGEGWLRFEDLPAGVPLTIHRVVDGASALADIGVEPLEPGGELVIEVEVPATYSHVAKLELTELPQLPPEPDERGFLELPFEEPTGPSGWERDPDYDGLPECLLDDALVFGPAPRTDAGAPDFGAVDPQPVVILLPDEERRFHVAGLPAGDYLISSELAFSSFMEGWAYPGFWPLSIGEGLQPPERIARHHVLEMKRSGVRYHGSLRGVVTDARTGYPRSAVVELVDRAGKTVDWSFVRGSNPSHVGNGQPEFAFQVFFPRPGEYELRIRSPGGQEGCVPHRYDGDTEFVMLSVE